MSGPKFSDLQTYGSLKEMYAEDTTYQENVVNSIHDFIRKASKGEVNFDGVQWNIDALLQLNESYKSINDDEHLPESGMLKSVFAKYGPKKSYSTIDITTFAATRGHAGGRPDGKYLDSMVKSTFLSFMANRDCDVYANGRGFRATIATATGGAASFTVSYSGRIRPGMLFDWYDSTYATLRGSIKIDLKGIARVDRTVYVDSSFGTGAVPSGATAGDVLVVYGSLDAGEPSDGRFAGGLDRITDNTLSLGTLSPSSYASWMSTNLNASLGNPSETLLQQFWDWLYTISGSHPNKAAFNPAWKRAYLTQFLSQRQYPTNRFDTGASELTFSPVMMGKDSKGKKPVAFEMLEDKNCEPTTLFSWANAHLCIASDYSDEPHLADEDGKEFRNRIGYDSMQGFIRYWWNMVSNKRCAIGKIYNHATPSGVI